MYCLFKAIGLCSYAVCGIFSVLVVSYIYFPRDVIYVSTIILKSDVCRTVHRNIFL